VHFVVASQPSFDLKQMLADRGHRGIQIDQVNRDTLVQRQLFIELPDNEEDVRPKAEHGGHSISLPFDVIPGRLFVDLVFLEENVPQPCFPMKPGKVGLEKRFGLADAVHLAEEVDVVAGHRQWQVRPDAGNNPRTKLLREGRRFDAETETRK